MLLKYVFNISVVKEIYVFIKYINFFKISYVEIKCYVVYILII